MSMNRQTVLASRPAAMVLALSMVAGLSVPFIFLPPAHGAQTIPNGTVELSGAPVDQIQAVPPNIAVTFDDSGSMNWTRLGDAPPWTTKPGGGLYYKDMDWGSNGNQGGSTSGGPWRCANVIDPFATSGFGTNVMNGVYYNPNVVYTPPTYADGTSFPNADDTLTAVWVDGMAVNRPLNPATVGSVGYNDNPDLDYPEAGSRTNIMGTLTTGWSGSDNRWQCGTGSGSHQGQSAFWDGKSPMDGQSHTLSDGTTVTYPSNGPYYYRLKLNVTIATDAYGNPTNTGCNTADCDGLQTLYNPNNWEAIPVTNTTVTIAGQTVNQYQNFANWYAYYRTRNQMARSSLSRVFGSPSLSATTKNGFGGDIRVAWQNLNSGTYDLPGNAIISALIDTTGCSTSNSGNNNPDKASPSGIQQSGAINNPPPCYRAAFFNWIFQVPASGGTPTRSAIARAGDFFMRGAPGKSSNGTLEDPYWQPPQTGDYNSSSNPGNELYCRQNFSILITDGLWNGDQNGPKYASLTLPDAGTALPDGVSPPVPSSGNVTSIYSPVHDGGDSGYSSLSDVTYNYWATNLRPDLYKPTQGQIVAQYLPDTYTGLFGPTTVTLPFAVGTNPDGTPNYTMSAEEYFNPKNDPATWPHMSDYLIGLGVNGVLNFSTNTDCATGATGAALDACDLRKGINNSTGNTGWPTPDGSGSGIAANIDDTWHAALAGRGQFFSAGNPQQLVDQLTNVLSNIAARNSAPTPSAVNASVATAGTLSFQVGYTADWAGIMQAVTLNPNGTVGAVQWDAGVKLAAMSPTSRLIFTDTYNAPAGCPPTGTYTFKQGYPFITTGTPYDSCETAGLNSPAPPTPPGNDTQTNRINYLRGVKTYETDGTFRSRTDSAGVHHLLGAIIHSQPVYVSYPSGNYSDIWPTGSPEGNTYDTFVSNNATRPGVVYVGANDGMLHAFAAPAPTGCAADGTGCNYGNGGTELWAFVPRAVYANLGNLTSVSDFKFRPTVDGTPVTRDVFFTEGGARNDKWHTILAGGVGLGGRGVYALDVTNPDPTAASPAPGSVPKFDQSDVLWEFDADMTPTTSCYPAGQCKATDLGYTVSQPNIGRIAYDNKWVVLVPNGYFPDCSKPDIPTADKASCQKIALQAPKDSAGNPYSALFVLDAQTGAMVAELKTPSTYTLADGSGKVISYGLGTPVMGDYNNDQVDDVAFAGDLEGNLWKFDLRGAPNQWKVSLVYQGNDDGAGNQGLQPITTMPRLFPDPISNSFMVVFGTGQYLGAADNGTTSTQAIMGVRDDGTTYTQAGLTQQYLHETTAPPFLPDGTTPNPNAGATLRCVTGKAADTCDSATASQVNDSSGSGGWFINLYTTTSGGTQNDKGERVVVNPGAIFASNTVVFETLLTGSSGSDPCNPSTQGAVMAFNAVTGGPAGVSSLGGWPIVGGRVTNARTSGSLPIVSALGGGQAYLPGTGLAPSGKTPFSLDAPIWRRRSWNEINPNQ